MRHVFRLTRLVLPVLLLCLPPVPGAAQETRYPPDGPVILDCAPPAPAPEPSCLLRIPPGSDYEALNAVPLGEEEGEFELARTGSDRLPDDVRLNATILLVDLSPGPGGGRRATFGAERDLIARFVRSLPRDERVAIYGFNENLRRLADFTTDRGALLDAVEGLELQGTNTRIATFVTDSIDVLADRDDALIRNVVLVSDGQEEGNRPVSEVVDRAVEAGVTISAIGSFWRRPGDEVTGGGMDFLRQLTEGTGGIVQQVLLQRADAADAAIDEFGAAVSRALQRSALIVPVGDPQPSEITMTLLEPTRGATGQTTPREVRVAFEPAETVEEPPVVEEIEMLFGLPALWVYIGAGLLLLVLLAAIALASRRRGGGPEAAEGDPFDDDDAVAPAPAPAPKAAPAAIAWLEFAGNGRRAAITGARVNVGRSGSNDIVIDHDSVSRLHAQIHRNRDGGFSVTDMDSLNGTAVGEQPVKGTAPVRLGETIRFGSVEARMVAA